MRKILVCLLWISLALIMVGCSKPSQGAQPTAQDVRITAQAVRITAQDVRITAQAVRITAKDAKARLEGESGIVLLDVRTQEEYAAEHIKGAILLPLNDIETNAPSVIPDKGTVYFVYCRTGRRSAEASAQLLKMGYRNIFDLGGIVDWPYEKESGQ